MKQQLIWGGVGAVANVSAFLLAGLPGVACFIGGMLVVWGQILTAEWGRK